MDPVKLKVVELRAALAERGLDTKGNKPVLVERLRKALEVESQEHDQDKPVIHSEDDTVMKETSDRIAEVTRTSQPPRTPSRASRSSTMITPTKVSTRNTSRTATTPNSSKQSSPNKPQYIERSREVLMTISESTSEEPLVQQEEISKLSPEKYRDEEKDVSNIIKNETHVQTPLEKSQEEEAKHINILEGDRCDINVSQVPATEPSEKSSIIERVDQFSRTREKHEVEEKHDVDEIRKVQQLHSEVYIDETESVKELDEEEEIKEDVDNDKLQDDTFEKYIEDKISVEKENIERIGDTCNIKDNVDIPKVEEPARMIPEQIDKTDDDEELEVKEAAVNDDDYTMQEEKLVVSGQEKDVDEKMDTDTPQDEQTVQKVEVKQENINLNIEESSQKDCKDRKRKRSPSPVETHHASPTLHKSENEPDFDKSDVILSLYDSDLNLVINKDGFFSATPIHDEDFCYIWAGVRASYGFINGKVYYETKITEHCSIPTQDKEQSHMLRLGWSTPNTSMQLGEEKFSYAYTSTGKKGTDKEFTDYGPQFGKNDVVGCYLDMSSENTVELSYTVNGKELGSAFSISKEELGNTPLFPHILSKNCTFVCNFGQEEAWCENVPGYVVVGDVELKDRVVGPCRPDGRADCEVIMMCGLPAAGKTAWARKHAAENPNKLYNILGIDNLVEKTGDAAQYEQQNPSRREVIIDKCNRALDGLLDIACTKRRNYILDQKNVYSSVQRRKMRNFYEYQKKAVVIVPSEEEYTQRLSTHDAAKSISDSSLMEMKANFTAPSVGEFFDAVEWVGLNEVDSKKLIEKYNKEGKEAGFGQQQTAKRARFDKTEGNRETRDSRNNRDTRDHRDRRNNYQDRGRNPPWRGNMGGWRGDRPQRGGYMRHTGGYGPPPAPWRIRGRGGPAIRGADRRGGVDRRSGNDRNRSVASRQGGWGPMSGNYQGSQQSGWGQQDNWSSGQSQGNWGQQSGWAQQWGGSWKGYGQGTYSQAGYNQQQQGYGNGNWNSWNQQYYNNQYWGQQQQSGQTTAAGGQAEITNETVATTSTDTGAEYNYSQGWQNFSQGRTVATQNVATSSTQQSHSHK